MLVAHRAKDGRQQQHFGVRFLGTDLLDHRPHGLGVAAVGDAADDQQVGVVLKHVVLDAVFLPIVGAAGGAAQRGDLDDLALRIVAHEQQLERRTGGVAHDAVAQEHHAQFAAVAQLAHCFGDGGEAAGRGLILDRVHRGIDRINPLQRAHAGEGVRDGAVEQEAAHPRGAGRGDLQHKFMVGLPVEALGQRHRTHCRACHVLWRGELAKRRAVHGVFVVRAILVNRVNDADLRAFELQRQRRASLVGDEDVAERANRAGLSRLPIAGRFDLLILVGNDAAVVVRFREQGRGQLVGLGLVRDGIGSHQRIHELRNSLRVDIRARIGRDDSVARECLEGNLPGDDLLGRVSGQVKARNAVMLGDLFADADVFRRLARLVGREHLRRQRVNEDAAVRGAVERDLANESFERQLHLFDVGVAVVGGEVEDR